jgi:uncharacterized protein (TIGR03437 family)
MRRLIGVLVGAGALLGLHGEEIVPRQAPAYSADSIIHLATGLPGPLAPNTLAAIRGKDLSFVTRSREDWGSAGGQLPISLPGAAVSVLVGGVPATLEYVSPTQVTFVVPPFAGRGQVDVALVRNGVAGTKAKVPLMPVVAELFELEPGYALARHAESGEWVTGENPLTSGEEAVLYATGLGQTSPAIVHRMNPEEPAEVAGRETFQVLLNGTAMDPSAVGYVGVMVGFPGIYEIRIRVPAELSADVAVHLKYGEESASRDGVSLRVMKPGGNQPQPEGGGVRSKE